MLLVEKVEILEKEYLLFRENYSDQRGDGLLPLPFAIIDQTGLGCAKSNFGPMRHGRLNYTDPRTGGF